MSDVTEHFISFADTDKAVAKVVAYNKCLLSETTHTEHTPEMTVSLISPLT